MYSLTFKMGKYFPNNGRIEAKIPGAQNELTEFLNFTLILDDERGCRLR